MCLILQFFRTKFGLCYTERLYQSIFLFLLSPSSLVLYEIEFGHCQTIQLLTVFRQDSSRAIEIHNEYIVVVYGINRQHIISYSKFVFWCCAIMMTVVNFITRREQNCSQYCQRNSYSSYYIKLFSSSGLHYAQYF